MRILGHASSLVRVQEDIVDVKGSSHKRLIVGDSGGHGASNRVLGLAGSVVRARVAVQGGNGPQALVNGADIQVNLHLVVLESYQRQRKTRVSAEPKLKGNVKSSFGESVSGSTYLTRSQRVARTIHVGERRIRDEGKLGGVTNHLEITTLLLRSHCELIPDVHPVTVLTVNSLTTDFDFHLSNELLTGEIQPTSVDSGAPGGKVSKSHKLINFGKSNLEISSVSQITVSADGALNTTSKVGLSIESLLNGFNGKVSVTSVSDLPESNLRVTSKVDILCAVGDQLH